MFEIRPTNWRVTAEQLWYTGTLQRSLLYASLGIGLVVSGTAIWKLNSLANSLQALDAELSALKVSSSAGGDVRAVARPSADFVATLQSMPDQPKLLAELQDLQRDLGLKVETLALRERQPSAEQLGRLELQLAVQGSYRASVLFAKSLLERHPGAGLQSYQARRVPNSAEVEGTLVVVFWSPPRGLLPTLHKP